MARFIEDIVPEGSQKIRFLRNTPYAGVDYGPDYPEDTAVVESRQAEIWIQKGRAVAVQPAEGPVENTEGEAKAQPKAKKK